ncbi:hypothetical protein [Hymenobacter sp.]|uniref:hypothetical protein n=1 Tax=Hymenobacter sp. TaxID=1898978 RepID=UPI00286CFEC5|nr:hypothetical protein [Hymenobacter sp.]
MNNQNPPLPPENDHRPHDQQDRAAAAQPNPNDPAVDAGNSPHYGEFGGVETAAPLAATYAAPPANRAPAPAGRDGSNDNPDEFSEFRDREKNAEDAPNDPADQPGHVEQNQDPAAVQAASNKDSDEQRAAWAKDDPRWAGGGTHNTRDESASTKDNQD